jgi:hypothetical protein
MCGRERPDKKYSNNPDFKRWLADTVFGMTYERPSGS